MAAVRLIAMHKNKSKTILKSIKDRVDYAKNPEKTDEGQLISSYACDPNLVEEQFALSKREYLQKTGRVYQGDIIAYQIRQSFKPGEITPEEANRIGYETAMRWTKGDHAFIVATHIDKKHIHNHIIYNSTNLYCDGKFNNFFLSGRALQKLSDIICLENGLSVIEPRKKSKNQEREISGNNSAKVDMLLNIQEIIKKGKGYGYERWAKVHNIKEIALTLLFLEEHNIRDYEELSRLASSLSERYNEIADKQKVLESRLSEITELKKHIINYSKTKDIYAAYRKSGYSKEFLEAHREEIAIHKAAKEAFAKIKGRIPKITELNAEYAKVLQTKKDTYSEYKAARKEMKDYQTAKYNIDQFLKEEREERIKEQEKENDKSL
ncbi:MAG: relaxase/mobilization nuclease domain-containing protein [Lachnospiraceae bacterium]|nr:relaxase/mobilization nuclease domain-containing protein [Lachnospiraceae bacterium]